MLPIGSYDYPTIGLDASTNPSAPVSFTVRGDFGPFYNGHRNGGSATVVMRKGASFTSSLLVDYNDVHLDQGDFVRYLIGTRLAYFFTPRIFVAVTGSVQQSGAGLDGERPLRLAQYRRHRAFRCVQRRSGGRRLLRLGAPAVALVHREVHPPVRDRRLASLSFRVAVLKGQTPTLGFPPLAARAGTSTVG